MFEKTQKEFEAEAQKESTRRMELGRKEAIEAISKAESFIVIAVDKEKTGALACALGLKNTILLHVAAQKIEQELGDKLKQEVPEALEDILKGLKAGLR